MLKHDLGPPRFFGSESETGGPGPALPREVPLRGGVQGAVGGFGGWGPYSPAKFFGVVFFFFFFFFGGGRFFGKGVSFFFLRSLRRVFGQQGMRNGMNPI